MINIAIVDDDIRSVDRKGISRPILGGDGQKH